MDESATVNEMENKISALERSNFDLKMQLFYLNKKYEGLVTDGDNPEDSMLVNVVEDKSSDVLALREEIEYYQRKVAELEANNLQLQLLRDNESLEYQKVLKLQPNENFAVLEEGRKREREVAKAVAEHDASLIKRLQAEIETLQAQRAGDKKLVDDCTAKLAAQVDATQDREASLAKMHAANLELKSQIDVLTDVARHQELLLSSQNDIITSTHYSSQGNAANRGGIGATAAAAASAAAHYPLYAQQQPLGAAAGGPSPAYFPAEEVEGLRRENILLRDQLQKQSSAIMNQAEILSKLRVSTAGMSAMELSEAARLTGELDSCLAELEKTRQKCTRLEAENEALLRQKENDHAVLAGNVNVGDDGATTLLVDANTSSIMDGKTVQMYR